MNCSNCKFLDAPATDRKKDGHIKVTCTSRVYPCKAPYPEPVYPASVRFTLVQHYMCAEYGDGCKFHEPMEHK